MTRFVRIEGWLGDLDAGNYHEGGMTHVAIPLRVEAPSAEQAIAAATDAAQELMRRVDELEHVHNVGSPIEGAYALLANVTTSLGQLEPDELRQVLAVAVNAGFLEQLRDLLVGTV